MSSLVGARVAIQGFGNVGEVAAQLFQEAGAKIVAVSDSQGGIFDDDGIDLRAAQAYKTEHGTLMGLPQTLSITNEALLELDCDILIPAALSKQITAHNAGNIKARLVVEAANGPVTPAADRILASKNIWVLPDILANAGGVTVSYYEWLQNLENHQWELEEVNTRLRKRMRNSTDATVTRWQHLQQLAVAPGANAQQTEGGLDYPLDLRTAALSIAVERLSRVVAQRGIWP